MPSDAVILTFDTSGAACLAALSDQNGIIATRVDEMARGQAEHLMPMLDEMLSSNGLTWSDLTRIGVGIGPGNFTGIRISVSAARGLALGLGIPAVGISTLDALLYAHPNQTAAVKAPRDMAYTQSKGRNSELVEATSVSDAIYPTDLTALITAMAHCAAKADAATAERPKPLYIKPADAAPSREAPPVMLS